VTLVGWHLESEPTRLVGVIQIQLTAADRTVREDLIKESEPVSGELPGNSGDGRRSSPAASRIRRHHAHDSSITAITLDTLLRLP
jgi:hypothetical protein